VCGFLKKTRTGLAEFLVWGNIGVELNIRLGQCLEIRQLFFLKTHTRPKGKLNIKDQNKNLLHFGLF
jgi:hypothetical protein